jgi:hypothetical protein
MKHTQLSATLPLASAGAALFLLGSGSAGRPPLLVIAAGAAALIVFAVWIVARRRRSADSGLGLAASAPPPAAVPAADRGATQIEGLADAVPPRPSAASPGLYGKIEVRLNGQPLSTYLVTDSPLPVGRDPGQSLVIIQEPIVSKLHCQIFARGGQVFVKDFNSTNGVYVRDEKVSECPLQDGDEVFLGRKGTVRIVYHR